MPHTTASVPVATDFQRLVVEQAVAREVETTAGAAPNGRVLDRGETVLLTRGREFLTGVLQAMARHTADLAVKKGGSRGRATAPTASATRGTPGAPS